MEKLESKIREIATKQVDILKTDSERLLRELLRQKYWKAFGGATNDKLDAIVDDLILALAENDQTTHTDVLVNTVADTIATAVVNTAIARS